MGEMDVDSVTGSPLGKVSKAGKGKKRKVSSVIIHQNGNANNNSEMDDDTTQNRGSSDRPSKKRRGEDQQADEMDTSRPSALFTPIKPRDWTVSLALPGSFLTNFSKPDHKTMVAGRIARAAAVFCVDEIIIFDDDPENVPKYVSDHYKRGKSTKQEVLDSILEDDEPWQNPDQFLYHLLSYAECPPHLRYCQEDPKMSLFLQHQNLKWSGMLPSMDMPHHLRGHEWCRYREGVVIGSAPASAPGESSGSSSKSRKSKRKSKSGDDVDHLQPQTYAYVRCGLPHPVKIAIPPDTEAPPPATRVTLRFAPREAPPSWPHLSKEECENLGAEAVDQSTPREEAGYYWGYTVRRAASISAVFQDCEYADGYDYTLGTSERGVSLSSILPSSRSSTQSHSHTTSDTLTSLPTKFNHLLLCFGGVAGLEPAVANDPELRSKGLTKQTAHKLFDFWVNIVPGQGSRTIRTEEAVEFGLMGLRGYVEGRYGVQ